jgi:hypothetical protein
MTVYEVIKSYLPQSPIEDYRIYGPLSLEDEAIVHVRVAYPEQTVELRLRCSVESIDYDNHPSNQS